MKFNELEGKDVIAVLLNRLSTSFNKAGVEPDGGWFGSRSGIEKFLNSIGNPEGFLEKILSSIANLVGKTFVGGVLALLTKNPTFSFLFAAGLKDPISSIIRFGQKETALVKTGITVGLSVLAAVAAGLLTGTSPLEILRGILNFTDTIYDFNFDTPDSAIWQQIKSTIDGLYGQAGDFLGSSFARLLLVGTLSPPKIEIDINGISLALSEFSEERKEDLLNGVSSFAWLGIRAVQRLTFLFSFLNGRKAIRDLTNSSPAFRQFLDKGFPGLGKALQGWGDEENPLTKEEEVKDWKISTFVENKLEGVRKNYGNQIGDFVEQFVEGFADELRDGVEEYIEYKFV